MVDSFVYLLPHAAVTNGDGGGLTEIPRRPLHVEHPHHHHGNVLDFADLGRRGDELAVSRHLVQLRKHVEPRHAHLVKRRVPDVRVSANNFGPDFPHLDPGHEATVGVAKLHHEPLQVGSEERCTG